MSAFEFFFSKFNDKYGGIFLKNPTNMSVLFIIYYYAPKICFFCENARGQNSIGWTIHFNSGFPHQSGLLFFLPRDVCRGGENVQPEWQEPVEDAVAVSPCPQVRGREEVNDLPPGARRRHWRPTISGQHSLSPVTLPGNKKPLQFSQEAIIAGIVLHKFVIPCNIVRL